MSLEVLPPNCPNQDRIRSVLNGELPEGLKTTDLQDWCSQCIWIFWWYYVDDGTFDVSTVLPYFRSVLFLCPVTDLLLMNRISSSSCLSLVPLTFTVLAAPVPTFCDVLLPSDSRRADIFGSWDFLLCCTLCCRSFCILLLMVHDLHTDHEILLFYVL